MLTALLTKLLQRDLSHRLFSRYTQANNKLKRHDNKLSCRGAYFTLHCSGMPARVADGRRTADEKNNKAHDNKLK